MSRLWVRLALAFVAVTLVTVVVVALLADWNAGSQFRHYLERREAASQTGRGPGFGMGGHGPMMMGDSEQEFLDQLRTTLLIAGLTAGGIGIVLGVVVSRTIAAPLSRLAVAAREFAKRRWEHRAPVDGPAEIAEVARAFNTMADELERAETLRRNLMADIAHELRTPLTVMQGNLRAMLDGLYPLEMKEIASLYDETRLLSRLVADLRELTLAESGQLPLNVQAIAVKPALQSAASHFALVAEAQQTQITVDETTIVPPVCADPDRLAQVLHNLLANALRHTPGGSITLGGDVRDSHVRIQVKDTGQGIGPVDLPHIFDRFYRADASPSGATGSAGLGLAIAKAWVEAMGGAIGAESAPGQGSTFWFSLRRAGQ